MRRVGSTDEGQAPPPGPLIHAAAQDHQCNECVPVSASARCPGLCIAQCPVKSAHPPSPLMLQIIQNNSPISPGFSLLFFFALNSPSTCSSFFTGKMKNN